MHLHKVKVQTYKINDQTTLNKIDETTQCNQVTAQSALYFVQEQGESAQFTGVNEHFERSNWIK
jgi:hypothetical protein